MKRYVLILILLIPLLVISACIPTGETGAKAGEGITLNFLKNMPPVDELNEEENFRVGLELTNYGLKDRKVMICVYDTPSDFFGGIPGPVCEFDTIRAAEKSGEKIYPETKTRYFPSREDSYFYRGLTGKMNTNIISEVYYPYETVANAELCIKKEEVIETPGIKCETSSQVPITLQYQAPITITKLQQDVFSKGYNQLELLLTIDLQKIATGEIIDRNKIYLPTTVPEEKEPIIDVAIDLKGITNDFKCAPIRDSNKVLLKGNQKTIKCGATINTGQDYVVNPLEITLSYGYKNIKSIGPIKLVSKQEGA